MNKEDLFKKIASASDNSVNKHLSEKEKELERILNKASKIREHTEEAKELCALANFAMEKGYAIQTYELFGGLKTHEAPKLQSDGVSHKFGFVDSAVCVGLRLDLSVRFNKIGIEGGGCSPDTLTLDTFGNLTYGGRPIENYDGDVCYPFTSNHIWAGCERYMDRFLNEFEDFKNRVYDFVDNIESYKCFRI